MLIVRLIADPAGLETRIKNLRAAWDDKGWSSRIERDAGAMVELRVSSWDVAEVRVTIDERIGPSDGLVTAIPPVTPRLFISDMDSTMIGQECIDELADYAGIKPQIAAITERAMQGELDFEAALRERVGLLCGLEEGAIAQCLHERITPNRGARIVVETLKAKGCKTVLVTGGFHHFADPVAAQIGFERVVGNRLEVSDGKLTGGLDGPVVDSSVKQSVLEEEMQALGARATSLAAGDGANDIPMLDAADIGVAYRAKPKARASANCWIDRGDLTSILILLGIATEDWAET
ncbi:phosphoserine phosphatase SerB [Erythrobacter litoralis]|uniref:Phosphoserine phosphatase n=1 Tax=Erythrobacter litoralis (strain HTCC2594) TaxID=314225 RepID=Q2NAU4_ERYLH|nr:phosphoserine phosphatase SerB [Erythrobacter litoralis]ABC63197.1 phosphoserine phosphatase [Erythrobacter litoralis HTCC2594]